MAYGDLFVSRRLNYGVYELRALVGQTGKSQLRNFRSLRRADLPTESLFSCMCVCTEPVAAVSACLLDLLGNRDTD